MSKQVNTSLDSLVQALEELLPNAQRKQKVVRKIHTDDDLKKFFKQIEETNMFPEDCRVKG